MSRLVVTIMLVSVGFASTTVIAQSKAKQRNVGLVGLLLSQKVHRELETADDTKQTLMEAARKARSEYQAADELKDQERRSKTSNAAEKLRESVAEQLDKAQRERLLEIEVQLSLNPWLILRSTVADELELTQKQRNELRTLVKATQETTQALRESITDENQKDHNRRILNKLVETREASLKLLTGDQRDAWKAAGGEPFQLPTRKSE